MSTQPWVIAGALLLLGGVVASKASARVGVPSLLLFIGLGMLAGSDGLVGIEFDDFELARTFGIVALGFILFSGGLGTRFADIRPVLAPGVALASVGVVISAALLGWSAVVIMDFSLREGLLLGAMIASTDAAAVFSILRARGVSVTSRLRPLLELESGSNDPAAVFLTVTMIAVLTDSDRGVLWFTGSFAVQMGFGALCGYVFARVAVVGINRLQLDFDGLYSVLTFAFVLLTVEGVTWLGGSGFLATYVAGLTMANGEFLHKRSLVRFHDAIAWLMQISMFVLLGLLVFPSQLPDVAGRALAVAAVLIFVARPVAVGLTLLPFRLPAREVAFVSWVGLRGATPIILATFPLAAGVAGAERLFDVVFFVVLASVLVQGTTIPLVARKLGVAAKPGGTERAVSFDTVVTGDEGPRLRELVVETQAPAADRQVVDLSLPQGALIVLVRRGPASFVPQGSTVLQAGDELLLLAPPDTYRDIRAQFTDRASATGDLFEDDEDHA